MALLGFWLQLKWRQDGHHHRFFTGLELLKKMGIWPNAIKVNDFAAFWNISHPSLPNFINKSGSFFLKMAWPEQPILEELYQSFLRDTQNPSEKGSSCCKIIKKDKNDCSGVIVLVIFKFVLSYAIGRFEINRTITYLYSTQSCLKYRVFTIQLPQFLILSFLS